MRVRQLRAAVAAAVLATGVGWAAQGVTIMTSAVTLDSLLTPGATVVVGDKVFSDFGYLATGDMPTALLVNVQGILSDVGNLGLRFQGGFQDHTGGGASDALITYTVTSLGGRITDAHLDSNLNILGNLDTTAYGTITETFVPDDPTVHVTNFHFNPVPVLLHDQVVWGPPGYTHLHVQKDILLDAGPNSIFNGVANMSFVDQTYSQVPAPAAVWGGALLAGVGVLLRRWKRSSPE